MKLQHMKFETIFSKAARDWPEAITFGRLDIDINSDYPKDKFMVEGLFDIYEQVSEKYIGHEQEIIWRNVHHAIYIVVHEAARYIKILSVPNLRTAEVRLHFEKILKSILQEENSCWRDSDIKHIYAYFEAEECFLN